MIALQYKLFKTRSDNTYKGSKPQYVLKRSKFWNDYVSNSLKKITISTVKTTLIEIRTLHTP